MKELIEQLSKIGFKENDAKVYIALLQLEKSNPTKISKKQILLGLGFMIP